MEIRYYTKNRLDCVKGFSSEEKEDFLFWLDFERKVGNTLVKISQDVYKCIFKESEGMT